MYRTKAPATQCFLSFSMNVWAHGIYWDMLSQLNSQQLMTHPEPASDRTDVNDNG